MGELVDGRSGGLHARPRHRGVGPRQGAIDAARATRRAGWDVVHRRAISTLSRRAHGWSPNPLQLRVGERVFSGICMPSSVASRVRNSWAGRSLSSHDGSRARSAEAARSLATRNGGICCMMAGASADHRELTRRGSRGSCRSWRFATANRAVTRPRPITGVTRPGIDATIARFARPRPFLSAVARPSQDGRSSRSRYPTKEQIAESHFTTACGGGHAELVGTRAASRRRAGLGLPGQPRLGGTGHVARDRGEYLFTTA